MPAFATNSAGGRIVAFGGVDSDPMDDPFSPAGWTDRVAARDDGSQNSFIATRDAAASYPETVSAAAFGINTSDSAVVIGFVINAPPASYGHTPVDDAGEDVTLYVDTDYGWQFRIESSGAESDDEYKLQYKHIEGTNTWTDVTSSSDVIITTLTSDFANGDDVPEYIGGSGTYTSDNNAALESTGALTLAANLAADYSFEGHLNFQIVSGDVDVDDTIQLRVVYGDGTVLDYYTDTPTITVAVNGAPTLTVNDPEGTADIVTVGETYSINYDLADSEDTVTVAFYYDSDSSGEDGTAITGACASGAEGTNVTCAWDTTGMTPGAYYVYGITDDGTNPAVSAYSSGQITINGAIDSTIYYSVGTDTSALYSGNASASSGTLTLAAAAIDRIGVGDEVRVGSSRYYISGRNSATEFTI
jgi:hypothetical protein